MAYETMYTPTLEVAAFAAFHKADLYPGDDTAYFKAPCLVEKGTKTFDTLVARLTKIADTVGATKLKSGKYALETLGLKVTKDEDGEPTNIYKFTPTSKKSPMAVDGDVNPMGRCDKLGLAIGQGSTVVLKISCDKGTKGQVRSYLDAVQVGHLEEYSAGGDSTDTSGFGKIEGGYKHEAGFMPSAPDGDDEPAEDMDDGGDLKI